MRFIAALTAVLGATSALAAVSPVARAAADEDLSPFSVSNNFGAPIPPWNVDAIPAWYYGKKPDLLKTRPHWKNVPWFKHKWICLLLEWLHIGIKCPKPPPSHPPSNDPWKETFKNLTGAIQADGYLTFGLVDTVADCKAMCLSVEGCKFVNSYHDVNGKDGSPLLTCSLYNTCWGADKATNTGGQTQPDGSINYIIESDGYCKK